MREGEEEDIVDGWEGKALPEIGIVFTSFVIHRAINCFVHSTALSRFLSSVLNHPSGTLNENIVINQNITEGVR